MMKVTIHTTMTLRHADTVRDLFLQVLLPSRKLRTFTQVAPCPVAHGALVAHVAHVAHVALVAHVAHVLSVNVLHAIVDATHTASLEPIG